MIDQTSLIYCASVQNGGRPQLIHWSFADPDVHAAFRRVAAGLRTRIGFLLARLGE